MKAILFIILQIFFATRVDLKIREYHSDIPQFLLGREFSRVTRLDQSRASENTWWIINIPYLDALVGSIAVYFYELCRILISP